MVASVQGTSKPLAHNRNGTDMGDLFSLPSETPLPAIASERAADPMRPEVVRGRYQLPHPVTGKAQSWQRVSNLIKMAEDTYHLELWKQRNVAKGLAMRPDYVEAVQHMDVKQDKARLNTICERAQDIAGAYLMSDEGTALHKSAELADYAFGSLNGTEDGVPPVDDRHRGRVQQYLDALTANGLTVAPGMIERVIVSTAYEVAGKFDRVFRLGDGSYVMGDLKTGDSLDLSLPSIAAQLDCYRDGINSHGVWDGRRYDDTIKVRDDFGLVVWLPSTRDEVSVIRVDLAAGARLNAVCLDVRQIRRVKAKHVSEVFQADAYRATGATAEAEWLELMNAAHTVDQLISIAGRARSFGQWTERLADQARLLAGELRSAESGMGS